ncbi:hypothetical protein CAEBREN_18355 [Caenorhabditis brenneri]|uniref:Uncharacterized protein n=1 Tax=Caenorhabditis brenneri TaxID=135651 RepID=G0NS85_CAEBE|nr:hypothetical protein CAEBREN_18355 [Caenorhabditis brenneri]
MNFWIILIGICFSLTCALNAVGVFTPSWIIPSGRIASGSLKGLNGFGIVPCRDSVTKEFPWFGVSSILMYITVGFSILILFAYILIVFKIYQDGFEQSLRKWINSIGALSLIIFTLTFISVLLIGADLQTMNTAYTPITFSLGYSPWLCVGSCVFLIILVIPSFYFSNERIKDHQTFYS